MANKLSFSEALITPNTRTIKASLTMAKFLDGTEARAILRAYHHAESKSIRVSITRATWKQLGAYTAESFDPREDVVTVRVACPRYSEKALRAAFDAHVSDALQLAGTWSAGYILASL